ncbi:phosphotransferase family protein [Actinomadura geliboluensis]|uniref:phosphotransferase family protein n=1 Tax=Actinomadura geliboluensis TaxID=882440 RepID=UPI0037200383
MITASWLGEVLGGRVDDVAMEAIGTGQIGSVHRLRLAGDGVPPRLVAKLPPADPAARALLGGTYRTEVLFYRDIAGTVAIRTPHCHHAEIDPDTFEFVLLLEDLDPAVQGDQLAGCPPRLARECVAGLAGLHGPRWCDASLLDAGGPARPTGADADALAEVYAPAVETFIDRFPDRLSAADKDTLRGTVEGIGPWLVARPERFGLVHGDYRLDNLLFPPDGAGAPVTVDWQTLTIGLPARDLSYFLATSLGAADRRAHERDLVARYHEALLGHGVRDYPLDLCWDDYRFALPQAPLIIVLGCAYGTPTERGDAMFLAMAARACAAIRDHAAGA